MNPVKKQPHAVRVLARLDASVARAVEQEIAEVTKRRPAASQVGRVFGCADDKGLTALVAPREDGAVLTVNDRSRGSYVMILMTAIFAVAAGAMMALGVSGGTGSIVATAAVFGVLALFFLGVSAIHKQRLRRRVNRIADGIVARVELEEADDDEELELEAEAPSARERKRRA